MIKLRSSSSKKCRNRASGMLVYCIPLFCSLQIVYADDSTQPALSATLEHRFDPTQQVLSRSKVIISAEGYRLENLPLKQGQVLIANTASGKTWFVDTARSLIHEVPYSDVEGAPELAEPFITLPGFIDSIPCNIMGGTHVGDVQFKGRSLERWQCDSRLLEDSHDDELPAEQYYSTEYDLVLFSRSHNKRLTELVNIRESLVDRKLFTAPEGLRPVTVEQFMGEY